MSYTGLMNHALIPPATVGSVSRGRDGRTYSAAIGTMLTSVPPHDAPLLEAAGWINVAPGGSGTTAQRNALKLNKSDAGIRVYDTTLSLVCLWDGVQWRNINTGAVV